jgi:hypothetical protein
MTVLGTAAKVHAGSTAVVAVYAGSVKVWPLGPPVLAVDGHATWERPPDGALHFVADHPDGTQAGPYAIQVAPAVAIANPEFTLGQGSTAGTASTFWGGSSVPVKFAPDRTTTAGQALDDWAGNTLLFTFDTQRRIVAVDNPVPASWVTQFGRLKLTVSAVSPAAESGALVAVPAAPATVPNPGNVLGVATPPPDGIATTYWGPAGSLVGFQDPALQHITNQEAVDQWAGMLLKVEFASSTDIRSVTVLGPTP